MSYKYNNNNICSEKTSFISQNKYLLEIFSTDNQTLKTNNI